MVSRVGKILFNQVARSSVDFRKIAQPFRNVFPEQFEIRNAINWTRDKLSKKNFNKIAVPFYETIVRYLAIFV